MILLGEVLSPRPTHRQSSDIRHALVLYTRRLTFALQTAGPVFVVVGCCCCCSCRGRRRLRRRFSMTHENRVTRGRTASLNCCELRHRTTLLLLRTAPRRRRETANDSIIVISSSSRRHFLARLFLVISQASGARTPSLPTQPPRPASVHRSPPTSAPFYIASVDSSPRRPTLNNRSSGSCLVFRPCGRPRVMSLCSTTLSGAVSAVLPRLRSRLASPTLLSPRRFGWRRTPVSTGCIFRAFCGSQSNARV